MIDPTVSVADELRKSAERRLAVEERRVGSDFDRKFEPFSCFETDLYLYYAFSYPTLRFEIERIRDVCQKEGKIVKILMTIGGDERELAPFTNDDEIEKICDHTRPLRGERWTRTVDRFGSRRERRRRRRVSQKETFGRRLQTRRYSEKEGSSR